MCWKRQKVDDSDTRAEASSVRVRLARAPANRYSPKPSFQPFEIPLRPRAEAEESIFKFVMETSGCNYGKRPNFHHFFFFFLASRSRISPPTFFNHPLPFPDAYATRAAGDGCKQFRILCSERKKGRGRGEGKKRDRRDQYYCVTERHWSESSLSRRSR